MPARIEKSTETLQGEQMAGAARAYLLLADDDPAEGRAFSEVLHGQGYACDVVGSADDTVRAFLVRDYDLILLSLRASLSASLGAAKTIRDKERHYPEPRVPIVVLSAGPTEEERRQALAGGIDDVVRKPRDSNALQELLNKAMETQRRIPASLIPREPILYPRLLASCQRSEELAKQILDGFANLLQATIADLRAAIGTGDVALARRAGEQLRQTAAKVGSGRIQRTAVLVTRLTTAGALKDQGRELLRDLEHAERDLATWREMKLGQVVLAPRTPGGPVRTTIIRFSSFLKNRMDIFSKTPRS